MPAKKNAKRTNINLLPREDFDRTTLGRILKWSLTVFRYIVIVVELIVVAGFLARFYYDVQISDLDDEIRQKSAIIDARAEFEKDFRDAQLKLSILSTINEETENMVPLIDKITTFVPQDARLTRLHKKGETIQIDVSTTSDISMNNFITLLNQDPQINEVQVKNIEQDKDSLILNFEIEAKYRVEESSDGVI